MGKSKFSYKKVIVIKLNRFEVVSGKYIEAISGQSRIGYSMSDTTDFYDMIEWSKKGGYQGSIISFLVLCQEKVQIKYNQFSLFM